MSGLTTGQRPTLSQRGRPIGPETRSKIRNALIVAREIYRNGVRDSVLDAVDLACRDSQVRIRACRVVVRGALEVDWHERGWCRENVVASFDAAIALLSDGEMAHAA